MHNKQLQKDHERWGKEYLIENSNIKSNATFENNTEQYPKAQHLDSNVKFVMTSHHHNEFNVQKIHAEEILGAVWLLTKHEWCQFFIDREQLRDYPPVTTNRWVTRISSSKPFAVGNLRCGSAPEPGHPRSTTYKVNAEGKWVPWNVSRCR